MQTYIKRLNCAIFGFWKIIKYHLKIIILALLAIMQELLFYFISFIYSSESITEFNRPRTTWQIGVITVAFFVSSSMSSVDIFSLRMWEIV